MQAAKDAIDAVFGDTSVDKEKTLESLEEIDDHCQMNRDAVREDIAREDDDDDDDLDDDDLDDYDDDEDDPDEEDEDDADK